MHIQGPMRTSLGDGSLFGYWGMRFVVLSGKLANLKDIDPMQGL